MRGYLHSNHRCFPKKPGGIASQRKPNKTQDFIYRKPKCFHSSSSSWKALIVQLWVFLEWNRLWCWLIFYHFFFHFQTCAVFFLRCESLHKLCACFFAVCTKGTTVLKRLVARVLWYCNGKLVAVVNLVNGWSSSEFTLWDILWLLGVDCFYSIASWNPIHWLSQTHWDHDSVALLSFALAFEQDKLC